MQLRNRLDEATNDKVSFDNYGGVSPHRYLKFFSQVRDRKEDAKLIRWSFRKDTLFPLLAPDIDHLKIRLTKFKERYSDQINKIQSPQREIPKILSVE